MRQPHRGGGSYPTDGINEIRYFAVSDTDTDLARRFARMVQTALAGGLVVQFQYTPGDTSGSAYGCPVNECRRPTVMSLLQPDASVRIPYLVWPDGTSKNIAQGEWAHYGPFAISEFRYLLVTLRSTGNTDLYVQRNAPPTESNYTCRPHLAGSAENCVMAVEAEQTGIFYVGVKGVGATNTYRLSVAIREDVVMLSDFSFYLPCMELGPSNAFGVIFRYTGHDLFWESDLDSITSTRAGNFACINFKSDFGFDVSTMELMGVRFGITFNYAHDLYWNADLESIILK
ncbi:MAG: hypothetical protein R6U27_11395 [Desulfobacterales bacterium]